MSLVLWRRHNSVDTGFEIASFVGVSRAYNLDVGIVILPLTCEELKCISNIDSQCIRLWLDPFPRAVFCQNLQSRNWLSKQKRQASHVGVSAGPYMLTSYQKKKAFLVPGKAYPLSHTPPSFWFSSSLLAWYFMYRR